MTNTAETDRAGRTSPNQPQPANQETGPRIIYEPGMTPAERQQARKEQLQNYREQEELRNMLARRQRIWHQPAVSPTQPEQSEKTKEERIADLYQQERDLIEQEDQIKLEMIKLISRQEEAGDNARRFRHLFERLMCTYQPSRQFEVFGEEIQRNFVSLAANIEEEKEALQQERRQVIDQQTEVYYQRLRLANSVDEEDDT